MNNYKFDSIVSKTEVDALKDMIFKRARERAAALGEETKENYTDAARADVMEIARNSFSSSKNPFSIKEETNAPSVQTIKSEPAEIEAARIRAEEIKAQIKYRNNSLNKVFEDNEAKANMTQARESLENRQSFMGALAFLNSQATISLISKKGNHFSALA